jgi:hypothetical protein
MKIIGISICVYILYTVKPMSILDFPNSSGDDIRMQMYSIVLNMSFTLLPSIGAINSLTYSQSITSSKATAYILKLISVDMVWLYTQYCFCISIRICTVAEFWSNRRVLDPSHPCGT